MQIHWWTIKTIDDFNIETGQNHLNGFIQLCHHVWPPSESNQLWNYFFQWFNFYSHVVFQFFPFNWSLAWKLGSNEIWLLHHLTSDCFFQLHFNGWLLKWDQIMTKFLVMRLNLTFFTSIIHTVLRKYLELNYFNLHTNDVKWK